MSEQQEELMGRTVNVPGKRVIYAKETRKSHFLMNNTWE